MFRFTPMKNQIKRYSHSVLLKKYLSKKILYLKHLQNSSLYLDLVNILREAVNSICFKNFQFKSFTHQYMLAMSKGPHRHIQRVHQIMSQVWIFFVFSDLLEKKMRAEFPRHLVSPCSSGDKFFSTKWASPINII